ncbi:HD-GYP domain-containing protein, partial [Neobacillus niacini]
TLDSKDPYTANHSEKVARYSLIIAEEMGLSKKQKEDIYIGGLLHDICRFI